MDRGPTNIQALPSFRQQPNEREGKEHLEGLERSLEEVGENAEEAREARLTYSEGIEWLREDNQAKDRKIVEMEGALMTAQRELEEMKKRTIGGLRKKWCDGGETMEGHWLCWYTMVKSPGWPRLSGL